MVFITDTLIAAGLIFPTAEALGKTSPVFRALWIARVLRLIRKLRGLARLFSTMLNVLPALANVASLLCLYLYIYTCLGLGLFGKVGPYADTEAMNDTVNSQHFGRASLACVGMASGELWETLIFDLAARHPDCLSSRSYRDYLE